MPPAPLRKTRVKIDRLVRSYGWNGNDHAPARPDAPDPRKGSVRRQERLRGTRRSVQGETHDARSAEARGLAAGSSRGRGCPSGRDAAGGLLAGVAATAGASPDTAYRALRATICDLRLTATPCSVVPVPFRRGDTNADAAVDIADAVFTLSYLFAKGAPPHVSKPPMPMMTPP